jgi:hypothetical protein
MKTTTMRTNMPTTAPTQISIIKETKPFPLPPNFSTNGALAGDMTGLRDGALAGDMTDLRDGALAGDMTDLRELKLELKVQEFK